MSQAFYQHLQNELDGIRAAAQFVQRELPLRAQLRQGFPDLGRLGKIGVGHQKLALVHRRSI